LANWSTLLPASAGPAEVETARRKVAELRERLPAQREAVAAAERAVVEAEVSDRERMASELASGGSPKADSRSVEQARQRAGERRREGEALALAVQSAETALGETVRESQARWMSSAARQEKAARARARAVVEKLHGAMEDVAAAHATAVWLEHMLPREQPAPSAVRVALDDSARHTANQEPLSATVVLGWLAQSVAEPEPQPQTPAEPVPAG
jgi:hypothetical protein